MATTGLLISQRKKISRAFFLVSLWFAFSLFASLLSTRPYPHYLLQLAPSLSLAFGLFFNRSWEKFLPLLLALVLIAVFFGFHFWHYPTVSYYLNFVQFVAGDKTKNDYFNFFSPQSGMVYELADYIQNRTEDGEKIFIWGDQPAVYPLSRRLPVGHYTVKYHIIDFNGYQETMAALYQSAPRLIVMMRGDEEFPELEGFLKNYYFKNHAIGESEIYWRREKP